MSELTRGTLVACVAPDFFKGKKIAVVLGDCKDHDNSIECELIDRNAPIKKVCVCLSSGRDSIIRLDEIKL